MNEPDSNRKRPSPPCPGQQVSELVTGVTIVVGLGGLLSLALFAAGMLLLMAAGASVPL